jgi:hypothetical protein
LRSELGTSLLFAAAILCFVTGCGHNFNNPADPANNGGFYGGVDPAIAGSWDEISPKNDLNALVCRGDSFAYKSGAYGPASPMNARNGQVFAYIANATEPFFIYDYRLNATGDTLYMIEDGSAQYVDPLSVFGYTVFIRSH